MKCDMDCDNPSSARIPNDAKGISTAHLEISILLLERPVLCNGRPVVVRSDTSGKRGVAVVGAAVHLDHQCAFPSWNLCDARPTM